MEACKHSLEPDPLDLFSALAICRYPDDLEYYLFSCDEDWSEVTDTDHDEIEGALRQADFESEGVRTRWVVLS